MQLSGSYLAQQKLWWKTYFSHIGGRSLHLTAGRYSAVAIPSFGNAEVVDQTILSVR